MIITRQSDEGVRARAATTVKSVNRNTHWQTFYHLKMAEIAAEEKVNNAIMAKFGHWL